MEEESGIPKKLLVAKNLTTSEILTGENMFIL